MSNQPKRHQRAPGPRCQRGLTLLELMIAMTLGLVVIGGTIATFVATSQSSRLVDGLSRTQETGGFAIELVARELRPAGYPGCIRGDANSLLLLPATAAERPPYDLTQPLFAWTDLSSMPSGLQTASLSANYQRGPILSVNAVSPTSLTLQSDVPASAETLSLAGAPSEDLLGHWFLLANCDQPGGDLFQNTAATGPTTTTPVLSRAEADSVPGPGNRAPAGNPLSRYYAADATEVLRVHSYLYYIGASDLDASRSSLRRIDLSDLDASGVAADVEIVDGVYDMRVQFRAQTSNAYETPAAMTNAQWSDVVAARVSFLAKTHGDRGVTDQPAQVAVDTSLWDTVDYGGGVVIADGSLTTDRDLWQFFSFSIASRNKLK